jgi:putative protease
MPVFEDDRGLYLFNCKELALFEFVPALKEAGVNSVKIEGRMKSIHYIATVVSFYRQVLDGKEFAWKQGLKLLNRVHNRGYSTGFLKGKIDNTDYQREMSKSQSISVFVGNVLEEKSQGKCVLEIRNKIYAGEALEVFTPDGSLSTITMPSPLVTTDSQHVKFANSSQFVLIEQDLKAYTILRRVGE